MTSRSLEKTYSIADLAEWSGMSAAYWREQVNAGRLKAHGFGTTIRVLHSDFEDFLEKSVKTGPHPARRPGKARNAGVGDGRRSRERSR